ncbi:MAG: Uncharacterised protein [Rhodobiaceae bacterium UBA7378]|nr:MAG: Uncharacterised protein [Rhodobiaceae bacterium UBA7378]
MVSELHMWLTFAVIVGAMLLYLTEMVAIEMTSLLALVAMILLFTVFPQIGPDGSNLLDATTLLSGFGNPALITVMALLVMAQGLFQSGALENLIDRATRRATRSPIRAIWGVLVGALFASALLNNTPVVLMTIPIIVAISKRARLSPSQHMMSLSFMTILGGMLTLIGSSTNLLVADSAARFTDQTLGFFEQTPIGLILISVGAVYIFVVMPRIIGETEVAEKSSSAESGRQYIIELRLRIGDTLVGASTTAGFLPALSGMTLQIIERDGNMFLPPFDDLTLAHGDRLFIAATRREISDALSSKDHPLSGQLMPLVPNMEAEETVLAELVVAPGSRMAARAVHQTGFTHDTNCFIIGVQRRRRMLRHELTENRLEAGDVLLVIGSQANIESLRDNRDTLLMEWSARELPRFEKAPAARLIFAATVFSAATGIVPIVAASLTGATLMVASGVLNVRQASRGFDLRIFLVVAAALAMSHALFTSGGATFITTQLLVLFDGFPPAIILSVFFLLCAVVTNVLSNNATAVLFTPLAVNLAGSLNVDPLAFILAVVFAANCSFATPIAYQTNLLVMTPGNYQFRDFIRAGTPLIILIWLTYSVVAPWYFGF